MIVELLVGGVFIALFGLVAGESLYLRWWGIATTGTIVAVEVKTDGDGTLYYPVVAFTTSQGERMQVTSTFGTEEAGRFFRVGERVSLRYLARKPTRFAIDGYEVSGVLFMFFFAVAAVAIIWSTMTS